jgi:hypothetical protein
MLGFTIDRVSLFALIFSIGILVDDAIVVVENIYRRWLEEGQTDMETAVDAVDEVGNPTILATFTVIARTAADGLRHRHDGALHGADPGARFGGDADLAVRRLRVHALARHAHPADRCNSLERPKSASTRSRVARGLYRRDADAADLRSCARRGCFCSCCGAFFA